MKRNILLISMIVFLNTLSCKKDLVPEPNPEPTESGIVFNPSLTYSTMTDQDGIVYKTIKIGNQTWMAENLRTTKYRNGEAIQNVINNTQWLSLTTGAYCWYNNSDADKATYGALYNWYAVADSRNIAPAGWHVPTEAEWATLITFLGGTDIAGGKMKETGQLHWASPNTDASNQSGFTALPVGERDGTNGTFGFRFRASRYWSTETSFRAVFCYAAYCYPGEIGFPKQFGISVRCVKD